jgi:intracellular multiplication protein IcmG
MAENDDIKHDPFADDEFHFDETPESEEVYTTTEEERPAYSAKPKVNRRKIIIIIGLLIAAFVLYKLVQAYLEARKSAPKPPTTVEQTTVPQVAPVQLPPVTGTELSSLQARTAQNSADINTLATQLTNLANTVTTLQNSLTAISSQLETINATLQQQQEQLTTMQYKPKPVIKKVKQYKTIVIPRPIYYVQAMIPGRAWLLLPDGTTMTVSVGSKLPGYGTVQTIDPVRGVVITSSGAIIRYKGH